MCGKSPQDLFVHGSVRARAQERECASVGRPRVCLSVLVDLVEKKRSSVVVVPVGF